MKSARVILVVCCAVISCAAAATQTPLFWQLLLEKDAGDGRPPRVFALEGAKQVARVEKPRADVKRYVYEGVRMDGDTFNVKIVIDERTTPQGVTYTGRIENNEKGAMLTRFIGPKLPKIALDPKTASLYIPEGFGRRVNSFPAKGEKTKPWTGSGAYLTLETGLYPSRHFTMPWLALETDAATWYAGVHDAGARTKKAGVRWYHGEKNADFRFWHLIFVRAGEKWNLPETVFEKLEGNWHAAAKRYRAWYDAARPAVRSATLDWTRDLTGWLLVIMKQQNEELMWPYTDIPRLCDVAARNGLNGIGLFGWTVGGHDHLYPDYDADPKMGGAEALRAGIAEAHRRGIRVCIYANGQLQQVGATKFWSEHGDRLAVRKRDGSSYIQTYHKYKDIPVYQFALGCLCGEAWYGRMFSLAQQAAGFGADAILYDQLGVQTPFECWGAGHGHPVPAYTHAEERPGFLRRVTAGMLGKNEGFAVFTEGLHDSILDTIGMFHACTPGSFMRDVNALRASRASSRAATEPFPELFRYTFPELVTTTRNPTPMTLRSMVNYAAVFGLRHEIEIRYMPDRAYVLEGKVPTRADYGEVKNLPSLEAMHATPPDVASAYMKAVGDFQREHAKYLLRGRFVDDEGFSCGTGCQPAWNGQTARSVGVVAKRFIAADDTSAVCVWNVTDKPVPVVVEGLGEPKGAFAPAGEYVTGSLPPDSIRLYVFK